MRERRVPLELNFFKVLVSNQTTQISVYVCERVRVLSEWATLQEKKGLEKRELEWKWRRVFFRFEWIMACNCTCPDLGFEIVIQDIFQYTGNASTDEDVAPAGN